MSTASFWRKLALGVAVVTPLLLTACGGDDGATAADDPSSTEATSATDAPDATDDTQPSATASGSIEATLCPTVARMEELTGVTGLEGRNANKRTFIPSELPEGSEIVHCEYATGYGSQRLSFDVYRLPDAAAASAYLLQLSSRNCPDPGPATGIGDEAYQPCGAYDPGNGATLTLRVGRDVFGMALIASSSESIPASTVVELVSDVREAIGSS